ncbi:MAG: DUF7768 domain-containing protein [Armatimonadota bacterium]
MSKAKTKAKRVFICSRYAGETEHNVRVAKALCSQAMTAGLAPFAPHLLYTQFLDDANEAHRDLGISMGLRFLEACELLWVYTGEGISEGMRREIEHAESIGIPVVFMSELGICP